jgi:hypothetical protein
MDGNVSILDIRSSQLVCISYRILGDTFSSRLKNNSLRLAALSGRVTPPPTLRPASKMRAARSGGEVQDVFMNVDSVSERPLQALSSLLPLVVSKKVGTGVMRFRPTSTAHQMARRTRKATPFSSRRARPKRGGFR